jgi:hypothetical protein
LADARRLAGSWELGPGRGAARSAVRVPAAGPGPGAAGLAGDQVVGEQQGRQLAGGVRRSRRMIRRSWVMRAVPAAAMSPVRMLIRVCIRPAFRGLGEGEGGELEPLAEGGGNGSVLVVPSGDTGGSVMAVLPSPVRAGR